MEREQWLKTQRDKALDKYESVDSNTQAYQFAAEAETYEAIKNGNLMFADPREALEVYKNNLEQPDYGMTAGRVRALKAYLGRFE